MYLIFEILEMHVHLHQERKLKVASRHIALPRPAWIQQVLSSSTDDFSQVSITQQTRHSNRQQQHISTSANFPLFTYHFYLKGTKTTSSNEKSLYVPLETGKANTLTVVCLHASKTTTFTVGKQKIKTS